METQDLNEFVINIRALTFQLNGSSPSEPEDNFRITEDGEIRDTEDNDQRILE